jgi:Flp pilus assembly protein TadG
MSEARHDAEHRAPVMKRRADMRRAARWLRMQRAVRLSDDRGAAAVEFALVMPILVLLLFGIVEFARVWNVKQVLTDAAREGARIAVVAERQNFETIQLLRDSVERVVKRTAVAAAMDTSETKLNIDTSYGVGGPTGSEARVELTYQYQPLFGSWILPESALQLRTFAAMRNE